MEEVENMLTLFGGYSEVVEKTVRFYIEKTGEWKSQGDDKYYMDAKEIADKILNNTILILRLRMNIIELIFRD